MSTWSAGDISAEEKNDINSTLKHTNYGSSNFLDAQDFIDPTWSSQTSYMTISDVSDASTPNANSSMDETFSPTSSSPRVNKDEEKEESEPHEKLIQEEIVQNKKNKIILIHALEKSAHHSNSSQLSNITDESLGEHEIIVRLNHVDQDKNNVLNADNTTMSSSSININEINQSLITQDIQSVLYTSSDTILEFKDPPNNNISNTDQYHNEFNNLPVSSLSSSLGAITMLDNQPEDENPSSRSNNNNNSDNILPSFPNNVIIPIENEIHSSVYKSNISQQSNEEQSMNHSIDKLLNNSTTLSNVINETMFIQPNLSEISQLTSGPDDEIVKTVVNISDEYKGSMNQLSTTNIPAYLDRCSPAQVVAVTGGAPSDIIRNVEVDFDEDYNDCDNNILKDDEDSLKITTTNNNNADKPTISTNLVRQRGHSLETTKSQRPVNINIDLRVVSQLTPSTPEEVDASSELVFSNFMIDRYMLEVSASSRASSSESNASASASVNISGMTLSRLSDDPVSNQLSSLRRAEPNSIEAIVARNLAEMGDEINRIYGPRLDRMIKLLPVEECPLEMFYNVARVLFTRGPTNWGQVITLFYFGYRLVVHRVKRGIANAFYQVCRCLINFCRQINIFVWIAQQGGWRILQFLRSYGTYNDECVNNESHPTVSDIISWSENQSINDSSNNRYSVVENSRLVIPLVLTSTGFVVIAMAIWIYLRRS
ncbi:unnamed protein product [Heterobilharzia americana]|nr:unnamed protein product [Heterobilharzia americana]